MVVVVLANFLSKVAHWICGRDTSPNVVGLILWLNAPDCKEQGHFSGDLRIIKDPCT